MSESTLLIIVRHPPTGSSWTREALETALVAAALGQSVSLLFMGDGVFALLNSQQSGPLGQKGTAAMVDALPMYDVERIHVEERSLEQRGLQRSQLCCDTLPGEPAALIAEHALVLNF